MRKIIQIATGSYTDDDQGYRYDVVYHIALCDDGSVWVHGAGGVWRDLTPIPQQEIGT